MNTKALVSGFLQLTLFSLLASCFEDSRRAQPLVFYVIGDWGRMGTPSQQVVANQMDAWVKKQNPKFIISTGDNFYDGGVKDVADPHWKVTFENVYNGPLLGKKSWYIALGNHDYEGTPEAEIAYHKVNNRWNMPARYYSRVENLPDGGRVRFIFLDTTPLESSYYSTPQLFSDLAQQDTVHQKRWLDSLTMLTDVDWKIVVGHHHVYTAGERKGQRNVVKNSLEPIFIKNKVDAYFCGHEHDLQHLKAKDKPTHYFLSGAGSEIRPTGTSDESLFSASIQGFMSVEMEKEKMKLNVVDYKGNILYTTSIDR